ncbi:RsfS/YbeB/iojap family protein [Candidatus Tremblaya phenacola]|uniref:Ribosomal silencing factor RsfS n=1 Tax=Candidatus Tremblayella phenacoccinincola TaxID=1010676 RepID=A0A2G0V7D6_9PROT|nr:RsfS/YbeB/iojap family protein [Candidatus Tremblaya phenacola]PHN16362.1 Ribosomal silencing factor RsfS [Candidatus Tremblaya phenacola]
MCDVGLILKAVYTAYKLKAVNTKIYTDFKVSHTYTIVTEGVSSVHIRGIAKELHGLFKDLYGSSTFVTQSSSQWHVVCCSSILVHIMKADVRCFYTLGSLFNNELCLKQQAFSIYI